jgi:hypothetical protein
MLANTTEGIEVDTVERDTGLVSKMSDKPGLWRGGLGKGWQSQHGKRTSD